MTRSEVITNIYALFNAPHNADINIVGLNKVLDDLVSAEREACAEICNRIATEDGWEGGYAYRCVEAIRARGQA
jgi:hypothetical protein